MILQFTDHTGVYPKVGHLVKNIKVSRVTLDITGVKINVKHHPESKRMLVDMGFRDNGFNEIKMTHGQFQDVVVSMMDEKCE